MELKTKQDVQLFLEMQREPQETTKFLSKTPIRLDKHYSLQKYPARALALIYDVEDYTQELLNIKQAARTSASREALRFGLVTNTDLIKYYKA